jgi:hypothetical protein
MDKIALAHSLSLVSLMCGTHTPGSSSTSHWGGREREREIGGGSLSAGELRLTSSSPTVRPATGELQSPATDSSCGRPTASSADRWLRLPWATPVVGELHQPRASSVSCELHQPRATAPRAPPSRAPLAAGELRWPCSGSAAASEWEHEKGRRRGEQGTGWHEERRGRRRRRPCAQPQPLVLARLARPRESVGGERWREVEEATDMWAPHVSEMREREKEN